MSMMRKFSWMLLVVGCGEEIADDDEKAVKDLVKDEVVADAELEKEIVWDKDGAEMVLIPGGSFEMGDHLDGRPEEWAAAARPVHIVTLDAFYMDIHEVTVGQFREFVNQSGYNYDPIDWLGNKVGWEEVAQHSPGDECPMIYVTWHDAVAYAEWAGKRLPTKAEWEYAARGGLVGKRYPWGDDEEVARDHANYDGTGGKDKWDETTAPVGSFKLNDYGLFDIAGNVYEWCQDWYDKDYYSKSPTKNPPGPGTGLHRVLRGGDWAHDTAYLWVAYRFNYHSRNGFRNFGFRCVVSASDYP